MADQISTTGDGPNATFNVYYSAENRQKRIEWVSGSCTVNKLYSALQNLFDELPQMDDGVPMSAQTPTEYTIGIIDAGDKDPWFIDRTSVEYLTGGALKTASWDRVTTTNTGIVRIAYTIGTDFDVTDIGRDIKHATDNDIGTLLDFNTTGSTKYVWVRPDSSAATNDFDSAAGTLTVQNDSISQVQRYDDSLATFDTDETTDANSTANADWTIFPSVGSAANDYVAIGYSQKFRKVIFDNLNGTAGTVGVVLWEFWNGSTWANLEAVAGFTDGTSDFKAAAADGQTLSWTGTPTSWATTSLNGSPQLYYIRARVTTAYTANPVYDQGFIGATGSVTQSGASVSGGESLWANIYSIGTIESNTHIYIYQNAASLVAYKGTTDWWGDGHIDILVNVKELGTETDEGYISVLARQYSKTYSYYTVDLTNGGRNPIPLQTGNDLDNQSGFWQTDMTISSGTFLDGEVIDDDATGTKQAVVTLWNATDKILEYYLIGDPQNNFVNGDAITGVTSSATGTVVTPTAVGPSALSPVPTVTFGGLATGGSYDIDEDGNAENYSIVLDCISGTNHSVGTMYGWTKYLTRRGNTTDIINGTPVQQGQFYIGSDTRIIYNTLVGSIADGAVVTQVTSGFTGTVVNHNTSDKILILRNSRGTFDQTNNVRVDGSNYVTITGATPIVAITPIAAAPFGTFAGGKFFCAPGVVLTNYSAADLNNFQLVDDNGTVRVAPTKVNVTIGNTRVDDKVAAFRLTGSGGDIQKDRYSATVQAVGATTVVTDTGGGITSDEPGKTTGGILRLVDVSAFVEYRLRFASWSSSTFTLANQACTLTTGTNSTTLVTTNNAFTNAKVGDLVYNTTRTATSYITVITNNNNATISPAISNQVSTDTVNLNVLPVATATDDTIYVPFIDAYETIGTDGTPGSETVQIVYSTTVYTRVRARRSGSLSNRIIPFEQDSSIGTTGMNVSVIRTLDTIVT